MILSVYIYIYAHIHMPYSICAYVHTHVRMFCHVPAHGSGSAFAFTPYLPFHFICECARLFTYSCSVSDVRLCVCLQNS